MCSIKFVHVGGERLGPLRLGRETLGLTVRNPTRRAKLDIQMAKATSALHSDQISTAQAGVAKSVVGGDTRAEEKGGICRT
jgi:hypothetical protein